MSATATMRQRIPTAANKKPAENQHVGAVVRYFPTGDAETVEITPNTGENRQFIIPVIAGIVALITIGGGVFITRKKLK